MRPARSDLFAAVLTAANIGIYVGYRQGTGGWIISSVRATTALVLAIGSVACVLGRVADLFARDRSDNAAVLAASASLLGTTALGAAIVGITAGAALALAILLGTSVGLWSTTVLHHVLDGPALAGQSGTGQRAERLYTAEHPEAASDTEDPMALRSVNASAPRADAYGTGEPEEP